MFTGKQMNIGHVLLSVENVLRVGYSRTVSCSRSRPSPPRNASANLSPEPKLDPKTARNGLQTQLRSLPIKQGKSESGTRHRSADNA